jgi:hypothetical protein
MAGRDGWTRQGWICKVQDPEAMAASLSAPSGVHDTTIRHLSEPKSPDQIWWYFLPLLLHNPVLSLNVR